MQRWVCWNKMTSVLFGSLWHLCLISNSLFFFFSSRRRHTRCSRDWSSDVCSSDLKDSAEDSSWNIDEHDGSALTGRTLEEIKEELPPKRRANPIHPAELQGARKGEIGRASCRERV